MYIWTCGVRVLLGAQVSVEARSCPAGTHFIIFPTEQGLGAHAYQWCRITFVAEAYVHWPVKVIGPYKASSNKGDMVGLSLARGERNRENYCT